MALIQKVVHVTLHGEMLGGQEEWQTGFYFGQPDSDAPVPTQAFTDAVRDAWIPIFTTSANGFNESYTFTGVKAARLDNGGRYDGTDVAQSFPTAVVRGGKIGNPLPPQIALVATLIAGSGKGLAGKGRMYLPGLALNVDGSGHISGTDTQRLATAMAGFFNGLNANMSAPGQLINASRGKAALAGIGARNVPVNGVRVGNVYDTQRRRRNSLAETYSSAVVLD